MGKRSRCCQRSGWIQGDCQCECMPVCTCVYLGASVQPLEHRCARTHVLMGECPSPGLLLHRQHAWSRAVLCTLGTTGTCPWACISPGFPLRSHSPAWNGPVTAAEARTEGWTHPATLQHLLGWLLPGCYCPQAVGSMPTCTDISVRPGSKHSPWGCWKIQAAGAYQA